MASETISTGTVASGTVASDQADLPRISGEGWPTWVLALFVLGALALTVGGVLAALTAQQSGELALGLVAAVVGAAFLITTPGWNTSSE